MRKLVTFIIVGLALSSTVHADDIVKSPLIKPLLKSQRVIRGQLRAREFTVIAAGLSGKLIRFPIMHGQRLKKGQSIAVFNCKMAAAEKAIAVAKLNAAKSKLEVNTNLAKYKNISQLEVTLSKAEVAIQRAELNRAQAILSDCTIKAPFSGVVTKKIAQAYQYIKEGDPLLELVNTAHLEVEMVIPSRWLTRLRIGTLFTIQLDEIPTPVKAKISRNVGTIDPISQTIQVIATLIKPAKELLPGMSGEINFLEKKSAKIVDKTESLD